MLNTKIYTKSKQTTNISAQAGEIIGYERGAKMVKNFYDQNQEQISENFIGKNMIEAILAQPGAVGITIISGVTAEGAAKPVLVGVDAEGNYILNVTSITANGQLQKQKAIVATTVVSPGGLGTKGW